MKKTICELFAGVGGFRLGFDRLRSGWETTWFSQWEPGAKTQWAHDCYVAHFGDSRDLNNEFHTGEDISIMDKRSIPDHTLLVGGFPCQDYSVAHTLASARGIEGKKGVLWWQIRDVLIAKKAPFCIFENVDRLLKSPAKQRGRDFGVILACLAAEGYSVEWRVVNAAQYGAAQRRRRTFIFAYRNDTVYGKTMECVSADEIIQNKGLMATAFPVQDTGMITQKTISNDIVDVSDNFIFAFENAGYMHNGNLYTAKIIEAEEEPTLLGDILQKNVDEKYYIPRDKLAKWTYLKGAKKIPRTSADGHEYVFSEGPIAFPDPWNRPGRTMLTSESTLNRSTHVVSDPGTGRVRLLTPVEAERLQGFDDDWTNTGMPDRMRYFCMGNALVVPMITRMGKVLDEIIEKETDGISIISSQRRTDRGKSHFFHKNELVDILNETIDKTFGEVDKNNVFSKTIGKPKITGIAGDVVEQSVLGYPADQDQRPDLDVDGILTELKTTGMRMKCDGNRRYFEAKEPVSITAVSIPTIASEEFSDSNFWHKVAHLLFVFYHYESPVAVCAAGYANFHIKGYRFHEFSPDDIAILRRDWQIIHDFIADIQAKYNEEDAKRAYPGLSTIINRQTSYLDTAPKYPHAPRFRLRKRLVSVLIQQTFNDGAFEKLPGRYRGNADVEKKCSELTKQYLGQSMASILKHFGVIVDSDKSVAPKQYAEQVIVRMFGGTSKKISKIEMFRKLGYVGKAVTVSARGTRTEDTKLLPVDFGELMEEWIDDDGVLREKTFEDSDLYHYLSDNKLLCVVFQENHPNKDGKIVLGDNMFAGFKIVDLSDEDILAEAKRTWDETRALIKEGRLEFVPCLDKHGTQRYAPKTGIAMGAPNLPKAGNHLIFFRGTGQDATDKVTINGVTMLRQDYWIKGAYLARKLKDTSFVGHDKPSNSCKSKRDK